MMSLVMGNILNKIVQEGDEEELGVKFVKAVWCIQLLPNQTF